MKSLFLRRLCLFAVLSAVALLNCAVARSQVVRDTFKCGGADTIFVGEAIPNAGTSYDTVIVINDSSLFKGDSVIITIADPDSAFSVAPISRPISFGPGSSMFLYLAFTPRKSGTSVAVVTLKAKSDTMCSPFQITLQGRGIDSTSVSDTIPLIRSTPRTIAVRGTADVTDHFVRVVNNTDHPIRISDIHALFRQTFLVGYPGALPITLGSHKSLDLDVVFAHPQKGINYDYLIIGMPDEGLLQDVIPIQGFFDPPPESVPTNKSDMRYTDVYPNPSRAEITLQTQSLVKPHVEITDMLGRAMIQATFERDWRWNRQTADGTATPGVYFIIVTGVSESGEVVREVRSIVLE